MINKFRALIERVIISPRENRAPEIEIKGHLAALTEIPAFPMAFSVGITVVANPRHRDYDKFVSLQTDYARKNFFGEAIGRRPARVHGTACERPASETLHKSRPTHLGAAFYPAMRRFGATS